MEWKSIQNFESLYSINENGDIKNLKTEKIMKPYITNKGYKAIDLNKDGKKYKYLVHRLVALSFIDNPNNYPIVLHKDNIKTNTNYKNLSWGTYSQNNHQAISDGLNKVPKPDNRIYYEVTNGTSSILCYGVNDLINTTKYEYGKQGMYDKIFRKDRLSSGPYKGYIIKKAKLNPAVEFGYKNIPAVIFNR